MKAGESVLVCGFQLPMLRINILGKIAFFLHTIRLPTVTIGILGGTSETQAQFKQVPKFVKKKSPLEQFITRKVSAVHL